MTPEQLTEFARGYTDAWNAHDADGAAAFYAPEGSLAVNGAAPAVSREAIAALMQGFHDAFPDAVLTMDAVRGASDRAVYLWTYEGTNTGPEGTGHRVRFSGWEAWTFTSEDLVGESLGNFDEVEYNRQLAEGI